MDIYSLLCFKTVADLGNLTKAAELLNISPSTLSHTIKKLESTIGYELFDRVGRNIIPSEYGSTYLPYVNRILLLNRQGLDALEGLKREDGSSIRIADVTHVFASHIIAEFQHANPGITLHRDFHTPSNLPFLDMEKRYDFIIGSSNTVVRPDLSSVHLRSSNTLCAVMNKSHRLANRSSITIEDLANEPMLSFPSSNAGGKMLERIFERTGAVPPIVFEGNSIDAVLPALDSGLGIFIQPTKSAEFNIRRYGSHIALIPISDCTYHSDISLFWSNDREFSKGCKKFRKFCKNYAKENQLTED